MRGCLDTLCTVVAKPGSVAQRELEEALRAYIAAEHGSVVDVGAARHSTLRLVHVPYYAKDQVFCQIKTLGSARRMQFHFCGMLTS